MHACACTRGELVMWGAQESSQPQAGARRFLSHCTSSADAAGAPLPMAQLEVARRRRSCSTARGAVPGEASGASAKEPRACWPGRGSIGPSQSRRVPIPLVLHPLLAAEHGMGKLRQEREQAQRSGVAASPVEGSLSRM